ncbi:MAG: sulfatase [Rubripirellula sp.]
MNKPSIYLIVLIVIVCCCDRVNADENKSEKPNIIFLLADDLGWTGLSCFGSDLYETPNLDRLAETGMKFTNAYAACTVCSPSRASIMTGMYPARIRLTDFIAGQNRPYAKLRIPNWTTGLNHSYMTIAEALHDDGYQTAHVGKWHLHHAGRDTNEYGPTKHGFDVEIAKPEGTRGYRLKGRVDPSGTSRGQYLTDYLTDQALMFIDDAKESPFFLYFAYHVPHTPIDGRDDLVAKYRKKVSDDAVHKNPEYAAMVSSMDSSVGRLLKRLEQHGIANNTLVIFTSDNGGLTQRYGKHDGFTDNFPLRRGKGSAYEGGVRVPTIMRWPGVTSPGTQCHTPISTIDYYPTLLEVTQSNGSQIHNKNIDGLSLVPLLRNPATSLNRSLFWHYPHYHAGGDSPYGAIRSGPWRLIEFFEDDALELYRLDQDPGEQNNMVETNPATAKELLQKLRSWRKRVAAQMPTPNPDHDPKQAQQVTKRRK